MSKKLKILLVVSLLFNGLLAGIILGKFLPYLMFAHDRPPGFDMADLSPSLRHKLDAVMQTAFEQSKNLRNKIDEKRQEIAGIMKKEPFDAAAFRTKNDELFTLMGQAGRSMASAMSQVAEDTPPEQRAEIARMLLKGPGPGSPGMFRPNKQRFPHKSLESEDAARGQSYIPPAEFNEVPSQENRDDEPLPDHP